MSKQIPVRQNATEIGIGTGNECETGTETEIERGTEIKTKTERGIGIGTGLEKETGTGRETEIETEIVTVIRIVCRDGMEAGWVLLGVRAVEGGHEDQLVMLTTEIGRWRREWDYESLTCLSSFDHGHFFVSLAPKDYAISTYSVSGTKLLLYFYPHLNC
jgi:hypothetical protein